MQVLKYVPKKDSILGLIDYDSYLECVWYKNDFEIRRQKNLHLNFYLMNTELEKQSEALIEEIKNKEDFDKERKV